MPKKQISLLYKMTKFARKYFLALLDEYKPDDNKEVTQSNIKEKKLEEIAVELCPNYILPIVDLRTKQIFGYEIIGSQMENGDIVTAVSCLGGNDNYYDYLLPIVRNNLVSKNIYLNIYSEDAEEVSLSGMIILAQQIFTEKGIAKIDGDENGKKSKQEHSLAVEELLSSMTIVAQGVGTDGFHIKGLYPCSRKFFRVCPNMLLNEQDQVNQWEQLQVLIEYAHSLGISVIAENVSNVEEMKTFMELGVDYAEGAIVQDFKKCQIKPQKLTVLSKAFGITIGNIVQNTPCVHEDTLVKEIEHLFSHEKNQGTVVLKNNKPIGLLMKNVLYSRLGSHYGISLYLGRSVSKIMDDAPLIVNYDLSLEAVSKLAMSRHESNLYDLIIVVKNSRYIGTVSIMSLVNNLTNMQIRSAANANPLTGLPGNLIIEERIKTIVRDQAPFAVMYIDLDNFKSYNDKYGFEKGDRAILLTAKVLSESINKYSAENDVFIGHIGGDDFLAVCHHTVAESVCKDVIKNFNTQIRQLYTKEDVNKGYIEVKNRKGIAERFPLMSISIGVVDNTIRVFNNYLEIGEVAAELKHLAKQIEGSVYVYDQRK